MPNIIRNGCDWLDLNCRWLEPGVGSANRCHKATTGLLGLVRKEQKVLVLGYN